MKGQNTLHNYGSVLKMSRVCQRCDFDLTNAVSVIHYSITQKNGGLMPYTTSLPSLRPFKCSDDLGCSIRCRCDRGDGIIRKLSAFRSPSGQFYVTTPDGVRIDCHNQQTAR